MTATTDLTEPAVASLRQRFDRLPWRGVVADLVASLLAAGVLVALAGRGEGLAVRLAGVALVLAAVAYALPRLRSREWATLAAVLVVAAAGAVLALSPEGSLPLSALAGSALALVGVVLVARALLAPHRSWWRAGGAGLLVVVALALPGLSSALFSLVLFAAAVGVLAQAVLRAAVRLDVAEVTGGRPGDTRLTSWIDGLGARPQERGAVYDQVYFEGPDSLSRVLRFTLLMTFASVISAMGVLADSTAVVVGAMLIAPLISPMMGMGLSLAMGWPRRLARSAALVLLGIGIAVGTGAVLGASSTLGADLGANSQVLSRASPTLADLVVAVAAGAAGAYALSRRDVSSSLPGVAIAIALVPPLSVVGITAQAGDAASASGTLLLFLTNLVAILVVGGTIFVLTGVAPLRRARAVRGRVRTAFAAVLGLGVLVVVGLSLNGASITSDAVANDRARSEVSAWLGEEADFTVASVDVDGPDVRVILAGPGSPPLPDALATRLSARLDRTVALDLQWVPRERVRVVSEAG